MNMRSIGSLLLVLTAARPAWADAEEASLHVQPTVSLARLGDASGGGATATVASAGLSLRASFATSDHFAYELALGGARTGTARFAATQVPNPAGGPPQDGSIATPGWYARPPA
jgi:hypothetical protein